MRTGVPVALTLVGGVALVLVLAQAKTRPSTAPTPTALADLAVAQSHFDAGYEVAKSKDFTAAAAEFGQAAALAKGGDLAAADNLEVKARFQEAIAVQAAGETPRAARMFRQFAKAYPDHYLAARALERADDIDAAAHPIAVVVPTHDPSTALGAGALRTTALKSQCGPQALAYALKRLGIEATPEQISEIAGTDDERGTTFEGLAKAAEHFGVEAKGLLVDDAGLKQAALPAIAWVDSDHFVVIETAGALSVRFWDPLDAARGKPLDQRSHRLTYEDFHRRWQGYVLTLQVKQPGNKETRK